MATVMEVDPKALSDATILNDDNWDSLALLGAIAVIDECYSVTVDLQSLAKSQNLGDVVALVQDKLAKS